jgi:hypothetical protein
VVIAVKIDLDTDGLTYQKWGGTQRAKRGDWLVNNEGGVYNESGISRSAPGSVRTGYT